MGVYLIPIRVHGFLVETDLSACLVFELQVFLRGLFFKLAFYRVRNVIAYFMRAKEAP